MITTLPRHFPRHARTAMVLFWGGVMHALAQIGLGPADCIQQWGHPIANTVNSNGMGALHFVDASISTELHFIDGKAQRAVYRAAEWNDEIIDRILDINAASQEWHGFVRPGPTQKTRLSQTWSRGEDTAMAELEGNELTIVGPDWYRAQGNADSPRMADPIQAGPPISEGLIGRPLQPPDAAIGIWRYDESRGTQMVLHITDQGAMRWILYGPTNQFILNGRWKREQEGRNPTYSLFLESASLDATTKSRRIGQVEVVTPNQLLWHLEGDMDPTLTATWGKAWPSKSPLTRTDSIPQWKPAPPPALPDVGTRRAEAIAKLGKPTGMMMSGQTEAWVYPWGTVWISNGIVVETGEERNWRISAPFGSNIPSAF